MQFKNTREPLPEIAKKLNVDAVVEGAVARTGDRVRITAQLIDAPTDRHLWANEFDHDLRDVLALQSELTDAIVGELRVQLTSQEQKRITNVRPVDPEAYQLYLKGRGYYATGSKFEETLESFQRATHIDPLFAQAYAGVAISYIAIRRAYTDGIPPKDIFTRAKAAAMKALDLDNTIGEAHAALGMIKYFFEWNYEDADKDFQAALALEPQNAFIIKAYANYLMYMGKSDDAIAMHKKAIELDPLSAMLNITLGATYYYTRRYDEGIAHLSKLLVLYPSESWAVHYQLAWNFVMKGRHQDAVASAQKGGEPTTLAYMYAVAGKRNEALKILDEMLEASKREYIEPIFMAMVYLGLDDKEKTFEWLIKAYEERSPYMLNLKMEPLFDPLRSDPRFVELSRKMGLQ
jgi:tetratricopeptide (TPR) repeat protein